MIYGEISGTTSYYLKDAHGDVTALADAAGTITKNYLYDAFGNEQTEDAADTNPFRYAGEYFDAESGNIYLRNRYYDVSTGRFISEDPIRDGNKWIYSPAEIWRKLSMKRGNKDCWNKVVIRM